MNAVPPELSDSFSFQGTGSTIINTSASVIILNHTRHNYAADTTRLLSVTDTLSVSDGVEYSGFVLASGNDNLTYSDSDGTCTTSPYISTLMNGTNGYIALGNFTTGVEAPPGTITYTSTYQNSSAILVTVNGLPVSFTFAYIFDTYTVTSTININSYTNSSPPFSTFVLPDACSNFTCDYCYSPSATTMSPSATIMSPTTTPSLAVGVTSSFLLMLAALVMFLFSTV